jgi:hypothetical protein
VALVASLDLVIAEDGPLWALAGLLGVRVWALCPAAPLAPRWLADADDQSLWRRNVQLIRPQRLSELVKPRHEKTSSAPGRAVDLSVMGGPVGPHWPVVATVPSSR